MDTDTIPWQLRTMLDPFVTLSVAASLAERVLLGASTLVAPWYSPLLLARSLTGVDVVTGGRLITGLGTGWSSEEYQGVGVPWQERGAPRGPRSTCPASPRPPDAGRPAARTAYFPSRCLPGVPHSTPPP